MNYTYSFIPTTRREKRKELTKYLAKSTNKLQFLKILNEYVDLCIAENHRDLLNNNKNE